MAPSKEALGLFCDWLADNTALSSIQSRRDLAEITRRLRVAIANRKGCEGRSAIPVHDGDNFDAQWNALHTDIHDGGYDWPAVVRERLLNRVAPGWQDFE